jgi:hypothetical protein
MEATAAMLALMAVPVVRGRAAIAAISPSSIQVLSQHSATTLPVSTLGVRLGIHSVVLAAMVELRPPVVEISVWLALAATEAMLARMAAQGAPRLPATVLP